MVSGLVVYFCLFAQSTPPSQVPPTREDVETAGPLRPLEQRKPKMTPPRLVAEAFTSPEPLPGRPVSLLEIVSRSANRSQQLGLVQSYWTLAAAVGEYNFCRQEYDLMAALTATAPGQPATVESKTLAAELALSSARLNEALLRATAAQAELAERAGLTAGQALPLPADAPHVGRYRTVFDAMFAGRTPPPRLQLLQHTLPVRCKAIDVRAEAVQAVHDSLEAAREAYDRREIDAESVASRIVQLGRQRKAFLETVRQYNQDIAEYALTVAAAGASPAAIVEMLIMPKPTTPPTTTTNVQRRMKPPLDAADGILQNAAEGPAADHQSYAGLLSLSSPKRTHQLARMLHWDRSATGENGPPFSLEQCLSRVAPAQRGRAVEAFWMAREHAARCQTLADQNDQLAALYPAVLRIAQRPGASEAMLDLRAWQQAAAADLLDAQAGLWERRLELAQVLGRAASSKDWPLPSTPPHGGRYLPKLEAQPPQLVKSLALQSLAKHVIPGLYNALEDRSAAIVRLDAERAAACEAVESAQRRVDLSQPLELVTRQASESLAFLSMLTRYNLSIAEYAIAILLPNSSAVELAATLVVPASQ